MLVGAITVLGTFSMQIAALMAFVSNFKGILQLMDCSVTKRKIIGGSFQVAPCLHSLLKTLNEPQHGN